MVITRGQTGSDSPVTLTPNTTRPVRPVAALAPVTEASPPRREETRAAPRAGGRPLQPLPMHHSDIKAEAKVYVFIGHHLPKFR